MGQADRSYIETGSLGSLHWLAIVLSIVSGANHLYAGFAEGRIPVFLAGVGFLAAVGLFLLGYRRRLLYPVGIVYTSVQLPLWYVGNAGGYTRLGYFDKSVQVVLIVVLAYLYWSARSRTAGVRESPTS